MTLSINQLKQIAKDYVQKDSPDLAAVEPTHEEEMRAVDPRAMAKLSLRQPHSIPKKVNVFTFKSTVTAEDGATIPIISRITVDEDGNVLKERETDYQEYNHFQLALQRHLLFHTKRGGESPHFS